MSDYNDWSQKEHAEDFLVFPKNIGYYLSLDETAMSNGELYTIFSNKAKKGSIVGIFKGTQADDIIKIIKEKLSDEQLRMVKEVILDKANSMNLITTKYFPKHTTVIDRFHVQKLACDAVQQKRINYRWEAIDQDNQAYKQAKEEGREYKPDIFENGDT